MATKTLQDFKDEIASSQNYGSWEYCVNDHPPYKIEHLTDEAAELYAAYREQLAKEHAWGEACEAQRIMCAGAARTGDGSYYHIAHDSILSAPLAANPYKQKEEQ